ncbi:MAG: hypothetical protein ACK2TZ_05940, partial [Anaerolineales bacterium]
ERLNSSTAILSEASELATWVIPNDFPEPGAPNTPMESGRLGRCWLRYSLDYFVFRRGESGQRSSFIY